MPELPEVENIRRQLDPTLPGRRVRTAMAHPSASFREAVAVEGAGILGVRRRGKYLLVDTDDGRELIIHLGMTGVLEFTDTPPHSLEDPDHPWRRAWWELDDGTTLQLRDQRRFGRVAVVPAGDHQRLPTLAALGPEPLSASFTPERFHSDLARRRAPVKSSLLSQRVVAGIGNIYADEALWRARVAPVARRVGTERARRLHEAIVAVLTEAVDHGGTHLRDYRTPAGNTGEHQWHLDCYGRDGLPCRRCATPLRRRTVSGRGTTWCPRCQAR